MAIAAQHLFHFSSPITHYTNDLRGDESFCRRKSEMTVGGALSISPRRVILVAQRFCSQGWFSRELLLCVFTTSIRRKEVALNAARGGRRKIADQA
jgi:hypothetical protein